MHDHPAVLAAAKVQNVAPKIPLGTCFTAEQCQHHSTSSRSRCADTPKGHAKRCLNVQHACQRQRQREHTISYDETACNSRSQQLSSTSILPFPYGKDQTPQAHVNCNVSPQHKGNGHCHGDRDEPGHSRGCQIASDVDCNGAQEEHEHEGVTVCGQNIQALSSKDRHCSEDGSIGGRVWPLGLTNLASRPEQGKG